MRQRPDRRWTATIHGPLLFGYVGGSTHIKLSENQPLILEREPKNPVDANAIIVRDLVGAPAGYVAREVAARVAPVIDSGCMVLAKVLTPSAPSGRPGYLTYARALLWVDGLESDRSYEVALDNFDAVYRAVKRDLEEVDK